MRISDWSSDVCSSDLLPLSLLVAEIRPSLIAFRMADLERPTRSAASFGPMEVLLTIAHLVLCTSNRMERGGGQLIGVLYSWQIWVHSWEGVLRRGGEGGAPWERTGKGRGGERRE